MLRTSIAAILLIALAGGCGDKTFAPGTAAEGADTAAPRDLAQSDAPPEDVRELLENLSQDLLDKLKEVETDEEAAMLEEEIWDAWLVSGSATVDTLMKRGLEYQSGEDLEGARDAFDRAIALKPDYAEAWNRRAVLFFQDGKYDEAVADLESAIENEPRHFGAWIGLAMIFEAIGRPEAALRAYEKAEEIHPRLQDAIQGKRRLDRAVNGSPL
jgi:tetratricopeptide (TPR) repeat protein